MASTGQRRVRMPRGCREWVAAQADEGGTCGFCISHIMVGNVGAALELAAHVRDALRPETRPVLHTPQP